MSCCEQSLENPSRSAGRRRELPGVPGGRLNAAAFTLVIFTSGESSAVRIELAAEDETAELRRSRDGRDCLRPVSARGTPGYERGQAISPGVRSQLGAGGR